MSEAQTLKRKLTALFRALRRHKLVARQSCMCCDSCACALLVHLVEERGADGAVYYHQQEAAHIPRGSVYVGYWAGEGHPSLTDQDVGRLVRAEARKLGLKVVWNGRANRKIKLLWGKNAS